MTRTQGPRSPARRSWHGIGGRALGILALLPLAVLAVAAADLVGAQPASAHARLQATTPAAGSAVAAGPSEVVLTFNEPPIGVGTLVRVSGPDDAVVSVGPVRVVDDEVRQTLATGLAGGTYRVDWKVTSDDGHPVSDTFSFTVAGGADSSTAPTVRAPGSSGTDQPRGSLQPWLVLVMAAVVAVLGYPLTRSLQRNRKARTHP